MVSDRVTVSFQDPVRLARLSCLHKYAMTKVMELAGLTLLLLVRCKQGESNSPDGMCFINLYDHDSKVSTFILGRQS